MGVWNNVVNALVLLFALGFMYLGIAFLLLPLTYHGGEGPVWAGQGIIEGGANWTKALLGVVFVLAASPMFYYVFSKNARGLPPPEPRTPPQPPQV